jgi:hypothetical protein
MRSPRKCFLSVAQLEFGWSATRAGGGLQVILLDKLLEASPWRVAT